VKLAANAVVVPIVVVVIFAVRRRKAVPKQSLEEGR
jgi:hypothetical protein